MTSRLPHFDLTVAWVDGDLHELVASAANDRFAGTVRLYASTDELLDTADRLRRFLGGPADRREFVLGQEDFAGFGTVRLTAIRIARTEAAQLEVALRTNPQERRVQAECCVLHLGTGAAQLARFEAELRRVAQRLGSCAGLEVARALDADAHRAPALDR